MPDITGSGGVRGKKASLSGSGTVKLPGSGGVFVKKAKLQGHQTSTVSGSGGVQAKKAKLAGVQKNKGHGGVFVKKANLHGTVVLKGSGGVFAKKAMLFGGVPLTGSGGVKAKKATLFGTSRVPGSGGVFAKKPSLQGLRRTPVSARINGMWTPVRVKARWNGAWVSATVKVMYQGTWYTVGLDPFGQFIPHGNVFIKKPSLAGTVSVQVAGSGIVSIKKPFIFGTQHIVAAGTGSVQTKKMSLSGNGKPAANAMLLGVNNYGGNTFSDYRSVIPNVTVTRIYNQGSDGPNGIPSSWPSGPQPTGAQHYVVSIRPTDINGFINGTYDAAIKTYLRKIPAGQYLCAYHEANLKSNIFQATLGGTAAQFVAIHKKLKTLADAVQAEGNPKINVGIIIGSADINTDNSPWVPTGMDWYGMDGYGGVSHVTALTRYSPNIAAIQKVAGPNAVMAIIESNDEKAATAAEWNQWFVDAFNIARSHNMCIFMTWWGPTAQYPNAEIFNTSGTYVQTLHDLYASV